MTSLEQNHSGAGDNVAGDKIIIEIRGLAPDDVKYPIDLVLESLRKKDKATAIIQMNILRATAQREPQTAALVEVIAIYGDIVETENQEAAWITVTRTMSATSNDIVKDICLAALLKLAIGTSRSDVAREIYTSETSPGAYAREAYLRFYADKDELEAAGKGIPTEAELTGIVEGSARLQAIELMDQMAKRLNTLYPSYNSKVLLAMATGLGLNVELERCHFWLNQPEVKEQLDYLACRAVELLDQSQGADTRVQELACSIFNIYQGCAPAFLFETLKNHLQSFESTHSEAVNNFKIATGDEASLSESQRNIKAAYKDPEKRTTWLRQFLSEKSHTIEETMLFLRLAAPYEIEKWQRELRIFEKASEMERSYVELLASVLALEEGDKNLQYRYKLADHVDSFILQWGKEMPSINQNAGFYLAEKLLSRGLPHKGLEFTSRLIPDGWLWPSEFVITHLRCLLEAEQYGKFEKAIEKIKGAEKSATVLGLLSLKAERLGNIDSAVNFGDLIVDYASNSPYGWYRGCFLRARYKSLTDQQLFHERIPDEVLKNPCREVIAILGFLTGTGQFKRAELLWVEWFIRDPGPLAVDFVNFYFATALTNKIEVSKTLDRYNAAVEYEQDGNTHIRLIVDDEKGSSDYTLTSSSELGKLLKTLPKGEAGSLGMNNYKVIEWLPPYVGCLRIALKLRNARNDGSDCFALMHVPSDPDQLVPYLEGKLAQDSDSNRRRQLETIEALPLYMRGHALYPNDSFKSALNCWHDPQIPKSLLWNQGDNTPDSIVLDAYGIGYLAATNLVTRIIKSGISIILPVDTKAKLENFINEISDENFMQLGLTDTGKLFRTTAFDIRERDAHILEAFRLIRDHSTVGYPVAYDVKIQIFSIKDGIDATVYDAIQLSAANNIPWFCMDASFASLHQSNNDPTANVSALILQAFSGDDFEFERMRHGFLQYSIGALPLSFDAKSLYFLAATPNRLAGFIIFQIIKNHGDEIFLNEGRLDLLLNAIFFHVHSNYEFGDSFMAYWPRYTPWHDYTNHVFNHGINFYLSSGQGYIEDRLANAMKFMFLKSKHHPRLWKHICEKFIRYANGHFMSLQTIANSFAETETGTEKNNLRVANTTSQQTASR